MAAHLQMGHLQPREQTEILGRSPVLRQVQQGQARPVGVRRPHQRRLHAPVRLDPHRPAPGRQAAERHPTTPPSPTTGPGDAGKRPCRSTTPACGSTKPRTVAARSATTTLIAVDHQPQTPQQLGAVADRHPARRSRSFEPARRTRLNPVSYTPPHRQRPGTSARPPAIRACLSRMPGNWHVRFPRGARRRKGRAYPPVAEASIEPVARPRGSRWHHALPM